MTSKGVVVFSCLLAALLTLGGKRIAIHSENAADIRTASQICEFVSLRAQVGAMRDVYDQAIGVLKTSRPNRNIQVKLSDGKTEYGQGFAVADSSPIHVCSFMGWPDRKLSFFLKPELLFSWSLVGLFGLIWMIAIILFMILRWAILKATERFQKDFVSALSRELGLSPASSISRSRWVSSVFGLAKLPLQDCKSEIGQMKNAMSDLVKQESEIAQAHSKQEAFENQLQVFLRKAKQIRHDLRSPLGALHIYSSSKTSLSNNFSKIQEIHRQMDQVIRELDIYDDFSQSSQTAIDVLEALVCDVVAGKQKELLGQRAIKLEVKFDRNHLTCVEVNSHVFMRSLRNLINNSVEAISNSGSIEIAISRQSDKKVVITITDDGAGIPSEVLSKIGQYGFTHGKVQGTGLGLAAAITSIRSWGGDLRVTSILNRGTNIQITLPEVEAPANFVGHVAGAGQEVFLLDDDPTICERVEALSEKRVLAFHEPMEFLAAVGNSGPQEKHLVIDLNLRHPQINGLQVAEVLHETHKLTLATDDYLNPVAITTSRDLRFPIFPKALLLT